MSEIVSLFTVFSPHLSAATLRQFCEIVFAVLAMTGGVTMRNISRWTSKGGSYRTIQRFYNTLIPWGTLCWVFFRTHLFDPESVYLLAGDESIVAKSGDDTYGLSRFFASTKILPQKPETIVIHNIAEHLGSIGAIHYTSNQIRPG